MKRPCILLAALLLTLPLLSGCKEKNIPAAEEEILTETTAETTKPPLEIIEIDPFEELDFEYYHDEGGEVREHAKINTFSEPQELYDGEEPLKVQYYNGYSLPALKQCNARGCRLNIYRELLSPELQEGDTVTLRLALEKHDPVPDIAACLEEEFGIRLTRKTKEIKVHFQEKPLREYDPFDDVQAWFYRDGDHYAIGQNMETVSKEMKDALGIDSLGFSLSLPEDIGVDQLYAGDKIKYCLTYLTEDGLEMKGDDVNRYFEKQWIRVHFTQTEKEFSVTPEGGSEYYSSSVNVMLNRPDNWYQIAQNPNLFNKYDLAHIDGSTATIPITAELVRQFCGVTDPELSYYIDHNTTGPAYDDLILGNHGKNLILVTEPSDDELVMAAENHVELDVTKIALDGFVFITHKDNPVDSLTVEEIQGIYNGVITNWSQVGGNDEEIIAYQREPNSGSQTAMEKLVMQGVDIMDPPKSPVAKTMGDLVESVAQYKNTTCSIGYTFNYYINYLYRNDDIKVLKIDGIAPDRENLLDQSYPFSSGYYAVTRKGGDRKAEEIKEYLLSDEGQEIIQLAGYCPVK